MNLLITMIINTFNYFLGLKQKIKRFYQNWINYEDIIISGDRTIKKQKEQIIFFQGKLNYN